jgi:hypothetical protein
MSQQKPETLCPRCGSSDLTYKNVFDYFKCNACKHTFITPKYVYDSGEPQAGQGSSGPPVGDLRPINGLEYSKAVSRELFGEDRITRAPQKIEPEVMPPIIEQRVTQQQAMEPQVMQPQQMQPQVMQPQIVEPYRRERGLERLLKGRKTGLGWLILFISILVLVLIGLLIWFFFPDLIKGLLGI